MMNAAPKILSWLIQQCLSEDGFAEEGGGLALKQKDSKVSGKLELIRQYPVNPQLIDPKLQAEEIYLAACDEAAGSGSGIHHFVLYAYQQGKSIHFSRKAFTVHVEDESLTPDESSDAQGLLGQCQRHLEATQRIQASMMPGVLHAMQTVMGTLTERLEHHERGYMDMLKLQREMTDAKYEREMAAELEARKAARIDKLIQTLGPVVISRLLPENVQPVKDEGEGELADTGERIPVDVRAKQFISEGLKGPALLEKMQGEGYDIQELIQQFMNVG